MSKNTKTGKTKPRMKNISTDLIDRQFGRALYDAIRAGKDGLDHVSAEYEAEANTLAVLLYIADAIKDNMGLSASIHFEVGSMDRRSINYRGGQ